MAMNIKLKEFVESELGDEVGCPLQATAGPITRSIEQLRKEYCMWPWPLGQGQEITCTQRGASTKEILRAEEGEEEGSADLMNLSGIKRNSIGAELEKSCLDLAVLRDHIRGLLTHDHELLVHLFLVLRRVDLSHPTDFLILEFNGILVSKCGLC